MADISASTVKALREETGQGMMECKKALKEAGGDIAAARDILRRKGLVTGEKKSGRATKEGLVAISTSSDGSSATMIEVQCETDFCARNEVFQSMAKSLAEMACKLDDGEISATDEMQAAVQETLTRIGENMNYARGVKISAPRVGEYRHHNGQVGVIVGVEGEIDDQTLSDLCMHIAFADPMGITKDDIPADVVEKEKQFAKQQAIDSGKPPEIAEKIVAGKLNKFLAANALLDQPFVREDKKKVKDIIGSAKVTAFARYAVGG
ncbi:MAG: translation elongation factor Ts [Planctomycetota bacterium]|jgi:elongation factor Ts